jgi:hypothetical protein
VNEKVAQFKVSQFSLLFGIMLGIQIIGAVSIAFLAFVVIMGGGGLDIVEFDPPGFTEACTMLPFVFPLTLLTFIIYPRRKGRRWAQWLLIFTVIVNVILAVSLGMVLLMSLGIFSRLW